MLESTIRILGPSGSGKSTLLAMIHDHVRRGQARGSIDSTDSIAELSRQMHRGFLPRTDTGTPNNNIDWHDGNGTRLRFWETDELTDPELDVVVLNPFLVSESIAQEAFITLAARVQEELSVNIEVALEISAELVLGVSLTHNHPSASRPDVEGSLLLGFPRGPYQHLFDGLRNEVLLRVEGDSVYAEPEDEATNELLQRVLEIPKPMVARFHEELGMLEEVLADSKALLVFSRCDLLEFIPGLSVERLCTEALQGLSDRHAWASNIEDIVAEPGLSVRLDRDRIGVGYVPRDYLPLRVDEVANDRGKLVLQRALKRIQEDSPPMPVLLERSTLSVTIIDCLKEVFSRTYRWFPLAILVGTGFTLGNGIVGRPEALAVSLIALLATLLAVLVLVWVRLLRQRTFITLEKYDLEDRIVAPPRTKGVPVNELRMDRSLLDRALGFGRLSDRAESTLAYLPLSPALHHVAKSKAHRTDVLFTCALLLFAINVFGLPIH